ncbi:hypothetical protein IPA_08575 [Ignicoccus pacificus DSM 13166]|uniref:Uncharacterized protein n=1 Tax=Ignicoccus pacificus DSM 13166 TaxID=940294 RepID=A0A977KBU5_9CREN|nr:hypothetical protein IPA_08575 [Ignicoccus pacificus DSM 13166]
MEGVRVIALKALKEIEDAYLRAPPYWTGRTNLYRALQLLQSLVEWEEHGEG